MNSKAIVMRDFRELEERGVVLMSISMKCSRASHLYGSILAVECN
jgi:hypothetical protein